MNSKHSHGRPRMMADLGPLLDRLDKWRSYPNYDLKGRAELFFSLYLSEVLSDRFTDVHPMLIPGFPLKHPDSTDSEKVDFFAVEKDLSAAYLIEIKTSMNSLDERKFRSLLAAKKKGLRRKLAQIPEIVQAEGGAGRAMYFNQLRDLEALGLITLPPELTLEKAQGKKRIVKELLRKTKVIGREIPIHVVYVLPRENDAQVVASLEASAGAKKWLKHRTTIARGLREVTFISFDEFREILLDRPVGLRKRFSESLAQWAKD